MRIRLLIVLLSLLILPHATAWSQEFLVPAIQDMPSLLSASDSVAPSTQEPLPSFEKQALKIQQQALWQPNSTKAILWAFLPGGGQIYNRKYWKLPIFYGGFVGCIYAMTWNNQMYRDYQRAYIDITDDDPNTQSYNKFLHLGSKVTEENKSFYQNLFKKRKDRYRRWRDLSIFATVAVYALSVIDAYVDASLSDFDISDDLSLRIAPVVMNGNSPTTKTNLFKSSAIGIGCSLTF